MRKRRLILISLSALVGVAIILVVLFFSKNPPVYYTYNGVTITKLDDINGERESHFFYGYFDGKSRPYPKSFIKVTDHIFRESIDGYLIFLPNKRVELKCEEGLCQNMGKDTNIILVDTLNMGDEGVKWINWHDSIQGRFGSTVYFTDGADNSAEAAYNIKNHSDVKVKY